MTKELPQRLYEQIRRLDSDIIKLRARARISNDDEEIERMEDKLLSLCKDYEEAPIILKDYPRLLDKLESKETFLKKAPPYEKAVSQPLDASQYAFYRIGEAWKMIWEYKEIVLKRGGLEYFHHCIEHNKKEFKNWELDYILNPGPKGSEALIDFKELKDGFSVGDLKAIFTRQQKLDPAQLQNIKNYLIELDKEIDKAEANKDLAQLEELQEKKDQTEAYLLEAGEVLSDEAQKISKRVSKAMERALKELKTHSEAAYNHLHEAFKPIGSNTKKYRPTEPIPWVLEKK